MSSGRSSGPAFAKADKVCLRVRAEREGVVLEVMPRGPGLFMYSSLGRTTRK